MDDELSLSILGSLTSELKKKLEESKTVGRCVFTR